MNEKYYSKRNKSYAINLSSDFWVAWLSIMRDFGNKSYLCEYFYTICSDGHPYGYDMSCIQEKIYSELGKIEFVSFRPTLLIQEQMFDLIEFFYRFIGKPTDGWFHEYCQNYHPKSYNKQQGRYEYTVAVNNLFKKFNHPYMLKKGEIKVVSSPILDTPLTDLELETDDRHLKKLIEDALSDFYDRSGTRKYTALLSIVNAYERLKTVENKDKKQSVLKVIKKLSPLDYVRQHLDTDLCELTQIANDYCIRHHEMTKKPIDDSDMIDFLFYLYFNYVRLILKKYNMLRTKEEKEKTYDTPF